MSESSQHPKRPWRSVTAGIVLAVLVGVAVGIGAFTFGYAKGGSYMTDDPRACANCHVMEQQYSGWLKSSHRSVAVCNDCHTPHDFFGKYLTKALNGWHHSSAFTTGNFPDPIRITGRNREIAEASCRSCHADIIRQMNAGHPEAADLSCASCHGAVGHPNSR